MQGQSQNESSQVFCDAIKRAGVIPSDLSLYAGIMKFEVVRKIPGQCLRTMRVELHDDDALLLRCVLRAWDTDGRFYHAYLDPEHGSARTSFVPPPDITRCKRITFVAGTYKHTLENDTDLIEEKGE